MRGLSARLDAAIQAIDAANEDDPTQLLVRGEVLPLALAHGRLASEWVSRLAPDPDDALIIAARAHHLRRWEVPRTDYPEGRPGYLRWRKDQKARHARDVEQLLRDAGYEHELIARVQSLLKREQLATDAGTQLVETAACLVFLETQLADMVDRLERDHVLAVVRKTAAKMTPAGLAAVAGIDLAARERQVLADALA